MKSTGIVRKLDKLGRIVIPIELRRTLDIDINDPLEIFVDGDMVLLRAYKPLCCFCGSSEELIEYKEKKICKSCVEGLGTIKGS